MENPAPKPLFGKIPEEAFDHVQPGCTGRCEVHMKARVALQPRDSLTPVALAISSSAWRSEASLDRLLHDPGPLPAADRGNPSTAGSVLFDSPEAIFNETIAPWG